MSKAKLHWSKTGEGESARYMLEGYQNVLTRQMLPQEYLGDYPHFYADIEGIFVNYFGNHGEVCGYIWLKTVKGLSCTNLEFREMITAMRAAGKRLTEINRKRREPVKFTVEI